MALASCLLSSVVLLTSPDAFADGPTRYARPPADAAPGGVAIDASVPPIVLEVLPATQGPAPDLRLAYSPGHSNGVVGAGWRLGFRSKIELRSAGRGVARFDGNDRYFLDGQELISVGGGLYRTQLDDDTIYERFSGGWEARRDGWTRRWGNPAPPPLVPPPGPAIDCVGPCAPPTAGPPPLHFEIGWHLTQVEDPFGNTMTIRYGRAGDSAAPVEIIYNETGTGDSHRVELHYSAREDVRLTARDGHLRSVEQLLTRVEVAAIRGGARHLAYRYELLYGHADHDAQSLLEQVLRDEVHDDGTLGASVTLRTMEYEDERTDWEAAEVLDVRDASGAPATLYPGSYAPTLVGGRADPHEQVRSAPLVQDVDGDARPDIVVLNAFCVWSSGGDLSASNPSSCTTDHRVYLNEPDSDHRPVFVEDVARSAQLDGFFAVRTSPSVEPPPPLRPSVVMDLDRDGYADLLRPTRFSGEVEVVYGSAAGWASHPAVLQDWGQPFGYARAQLADVDGDGFVDLVSQHHWVRNRASLPGFSRASDPLFDWSAAMRMEDPLVPFDASAGATDDSYDWVGSAGGDCMRGDDAHRVDIEDTPTIYGSGPGYRFFSSSGIQADYWVWKHTVNADFNGDGIMDRLLAVPWPERTSHLANWVTGAGHVMVSYRDTWEVPATPGTCGEQHRLYLGDGHGGFHDAGYAAGGMLSRSLSTYTEGGGGYSRQYRTPLRHVTPVDLSGSGRPEVLQHCSAYPGDDPQPFGLTDLGVTSSTTWPDVGTGIAAAESSPWDRAAVCPALTTRALPIDHVGLSLADSHYGTLSDLDGDGLSDIIEIVPHTGATPSGGASIWYPSARAGAQNRLVAILGPRGGELRFSWTTSARGDNHIPVSVPSLASIDGPSGLVEIERGGARFFDGAVEAFLYERQTRPDGSGAGPSVLRTYDVNVQGLPRTEETYRSDGTLHELVVHAHGAPAGRGGGWFVDATPPYRNRVIRTCRFELRPRHYTEADVMPLVSRCDAFSGEAPGPQAELPPQPEIEGGIDGPGERPQASSSDADPLVWAGLTERMYVTEVDYHTAHGRPVERRLYRDVSTTADSVVEQYEYDSPTSSFHRLSRRLSRDALGAELDERFSLFVGDRWGLLEQSGVRLAPLASSGSRARSRTVDPGSGQLEVDEAFGGHQQERRDHHACGVERIEDAVGRTRQVAYDDRCRVETVHGSEGLAVTYAYDGFHRRTHERHAAAPSADRQVWHDYDMEASGTLDPAEVRVSPHHDGTFTLHRTFRDAYGRAIREQRCRLDTAVCADPATCRAGASLASVYKCDAAEAPVTRDLAYDARGNLQRDSGWHSPTGPVHAVEHTYDELDRPWRTLYPDGATESMAYGLGEATRTDPTGARVRIATSTTARYRYYAGRRRGASYVDAFGEELGSRDGEGELTRSDPDHFGRLRRLRLPEVDVLETCSSGTTRVSPTESYRWRDDDVLVERTTPRGAVYAVARDALGRATSVTWDDPADSLPPERIEQREFLDAASASSVHGLPFSASMMRVVGRAGDRREQILDGAGRLIATIRPAPSELTDPTTGGPYDPSAGPEALRRESIVRYDAAGWLRSSSDSIGTKQRFDRDRFGRTIARHVESGPATARVVATERFERDARGLVTRAEDADGAVRHTTYDPMGRVLSRHLGTHVTGSRLLEDNVYDLAGRLIDSRIDGVDHHFVYDALSRVEEHHEGYTSVDSLLRETYEYDADDRLERATNGALEELEYVRDERGEVVAVRRFGLDASGSRVLVGERTRELGVDGAPTRTSDERGVETCYAYDALGRVVEETPAAAPGVTGSTTRTYAYLTNPVHPATGARTLSTAVRVTEATGEVQLVHRDADGRAWLEVSPDGTASAAEYEHGVRVRAVEYEDDADGDGLRAETRVRLYGHHPGSSRLAWRSAWLDPSDEATCASAPASCPGSTAHFTYTAAGRSLTTEDGQGNVHRSTYRTDGSMLRDTLTIDGVTAYRYLWSSAYALLDGWDVGTAAPYIKHRLFRRRNLFVERVRRERLSESEEVERTFDDAGRADSEVLDRNGAFESAIGTTFGPDGLPASRTVTADLAGSLRSATVGFAYEPNGLLREVSYPSGRNVVYHYATSSNHLTHVQTGLRRVVDVLTYDESGRPLDTRYAPTSPQAVDESVAYDAAGRLDTRDLSFVTAGVSFLETHGYDRRGRLTRVARAYSAGGTDETTTYAYDAAGHLTGERYERSTSDYDDYVHGYDRAGLRRSTTLDMSGVGTSTQTLTYASGHQLDRVDGVSIPFDDYGRQTGDEHGQQMTFGLGNQLRAVRDSGGSLVESSTHLPDGQRVSRSALSGQHFYVMGATPGELLYHEVGGSAEDVVSLPGGPPVATIDASGDLSVLASAAHGSPDAIRAPSGDHLRRQTAWGASRPGAPSDPVDLGFHHMVRSQETGLLTAGVRAYDPTTGRFLSPDPLGFASSGDLTESTDVYRYAGQNPVLFRDRSGFHREGGRHRHRVVEMEIEPGQPLPDNAWYGICSGRSTACVVNLVEPRSRGSRRERRSLERRDSAESDEVAGDPLEDLIRREAREHAAELDRERDLFDRNVEFHELRGGLERYRGGYLCPVGRVAACNMAYYRDGQHQSYRDALHSGDELEMLRAQNRLFDQFYWDSSIEFLYGQVPGLNTYLSAHQVVTGRHAFEDRELTNLEYTLEAAGLAAEVTPVDEIGGLMASGARRFLSRAEPVVTVTRQASRAVDLLPNGRVTDDGVRALIDSLPDRHGVYVLFDPEAREVYVGESSRAAATGIRTRLRGALNGKHDKAYEMLTREGVEVSYFLTDGSQLGDDVAARLVETRWIDEMSENGVELLNAPRNDTIAYSRPDGNDQESASQVVEDFFELVWQAGHRNHRGQSFDSEAHFRDGL